MKTAPTPVIGKKNNRNNNQGQNYRVTLQKKKVHKFQRKVSFIYMIIGLKDAFRW